MMTIYAKPLHKLLIYYRKKQLQGNFMKNQSSFYTALLFCLFVLPSTTIHAKSGSGITDIYLKAVEKDAVIAAQRAGTVAGKEKESQGLSQLLPTMNAGANVSYAYSKTTYDTAPERDSSDTSDSNGINFQLTQPLFRLSNFSAYSQSKLAGTVSDIQLNIAQQNLILRVSKAYFDILSAKESFSVAKSQTKAFKENLERAKLTFKVGTATKTDKLEAQARYDLARASELSALNQLAIAKQTLASIIGEEPDKLKPLRKKAKLLKVDPQNMEHWVDSAVNQNLNIKLSRLGVKTSQLEISKLKYDRLPVIDFIAKANYNNQYASFFNSDSVNQGASVSLQLSVPIYTGGLMSSRIREAEAVRTQQKFNHTDVQRQIILQTQQAYLTALNGYLQVDALKQASISSQSALRATRKGMEVGVRTNLDLLNAQQQFFETERDYTVAKYNYLLTVLNLKAAAGSLNKSDIENLNKLLKK